MRTAVQTSLAKQLNETICPKQVVNCRSSQLFEIQLNEFLRLFERKTIFCDEYHYFSLLHTLQDSQYFK